jgi:hypothetical protein
LLGDTIADRIANDFAVNLGPGDSFPPLASPREGSVVTDAVWGAGDDIAVAAASYVLENFAAITACGDSPSDDCGRGFVLDFATRAYRRPLSQDESTSLAQVYDETRAVLGDVKQAVQFGVNAALEAPEFLYRTEFGADPIQAGAMSPYELASALSYFLVDAPPDAALLAAAGSGHLASADQLLAQVNRLLASDGARRALEGALFSYFRLPVLDSLVFDTAQLPALNGSLRESMKGEATRFLSDILWDHPLADLLTSRRAHIDANLASVVYGVPFPPAGATLDSAGFTAVDLPASRAGLITQAAMLAVRWSSFQSLIRRGLAIRSDYLCAPPLDFDPPFHLNQMASSGTATQIANQRLAKPECAACHGEVDPFGIAMEGLDDFGRVRTADDMGRPIDTAAVLPTIAGGAHVTGAAEMAAALAKSDRFTACLSHNLLSYAVPAIETEDYQALAPASCANRAVVGTIGAAPPQFADLIRGIATSRAFTQRRAGGAP